MPHINTKEQLGKSNIYANMYADTTKSFVSTGTLLLKWKGSIYKLIFQHWLIWLFAYLFISIIYRHGLNDNKYGEFYRG